MPAPSSLPEPGPSLRRTSATTGRLAAVVLLLFFSLPQANAQEDPPSGESGPLVIRITDVRRYFLWGWNLLPTGFDVTADYRIAPWFAGLDTYLRLSIGGGYEGFGTFRHIDYTPNTQVVPAEATAATDGHREFNSPNFQWQAGIRQGILWNPSQERNLLEGFLYYRGRYDRYLKGRTYWGSSDSQIAMIEENHETWQQQYKGTDAYGIFGNSIFGGLAYDTLAYDRRSKTYQGTYAEASLELSPYLPSVLGATDFWRLNFSTKTFWTLYKARPAAEKNLFSIYAGSYFSIDYADARRQMPQYVMQSFGGTLLRKGLADSVRGFEKYSWDTQLKIVHNLDFRFNLPVLYTFRDRDLMPGLVAYFDLGYGAGYWGDATGTPGGFLGSTGIGLYADMFDLVFTQLYLEFPLIGNRLDGAPLVLDLEIGLHF